MNFYPCLFRKDAASDAAKTAKKTADSAKATGDQKLKEAKKSGENLKKKVSDGAEDVWVEPEWSLESLTLIYLF